MISSHIISAFNDLFPYDFLSHPHLFPPVGSLGYDNDFRTNDLFPDRFPPALPYFFSPEAKKSGRRELFKLVERLTF